MPWQAYVADVALEVEPATGRFAYKLVVITVPRQSGKTTLDGAVMEHRTMSTKRARVWFTMQTGKDAVDWLVNEHWPQLAPLGGLVRLRRQAGSEHVLWPMSGGLLRPFPPTPAGLHSKTSDLVLVDECWRFDLLAGQALDQAIVPTQATRPNAQTWKVSTAGQADSLWWLGQVEAGRAAALAGRRSGVAFFEWSCPLDQDPTDPATWPTYHPAYGRTIGDEAMHAALDQLGHEGFARAYGNQWVSVQARVIPVEAWRRAAEDPAELPAAGRLALGFDAALDRSDAAIVAAWRDPSGMAHIEVAHYESGVAWLPDRLGELEDRWRPIAVAYDAAGPALDLADAYARRESSSTSTAHGMTAREYAGACLALLEALVGDPPALRYRPHPALDTAAAGAARRALGDAWAWGRRQSAGSLAPLTAATAALWAYDHAPAALGDFRIF
jgi:phage terminase large subunit-like protein